MFGDSNISPTQIPKYFHKTLKKWKVKSEKGGRMFVKFPLESFVFKTPEGTVAIRGTKF